MYGPAYTFQRRLRFQVTTEDVENSAKVDTFGVKKSDSNPSLYGDLPRLKQSKQRTPSPARSTIKGKKRVDLFEDEKDEGAVNWTELESESRCSSVSGLSSYEDEGKFMRVGRRTRGLAADTARQERGERTACKGIVDRLCFGLDFHRRSRNWSSRARFGRRRGAGNLRWNG